jgi:tetratricopeptide (TPR) repeat protein
MNRQRVGHGWAVGVGSSSAARWGARLLGLVVVLAGLVAVPLGAGAQNERAQELVEQARAHFLAGEYVECARVFGQAFDLDPHPNILFNQARCYEELGDLPRALDLLRRARTLNPSANTDQQCRDKITEIEQLLIEQGYDLESIDPETFVALASVSITSLPEGAQVTLDGRAMGTTPIDGLFMAPGTYVVEVTMSGYQTHRRTIDIEAGRNVSVHAGLRRLEAADYLPPEPGYLELTGPRRDMSVYLDEDLIGYTPLSGVAVPPGNYRLRVVHEDYRDWALDIEIRSSDTASFYADAERLAQVEEDTFGATEWGVVSLCTGGAFAVTGVVLAVFAQADADRYHRNVNSVTRGEIRQAAIDQALLADLSFGVGAAFLATGAVLIWVVGDDDDEWYEDEDLVRLQWQVNPEGLGFGLSGSW